jgi:uncharacterized protein (DUF58 family)
MAGSRLIFPLIPRRPVLALSVGLTRSVRRGVGSDVAGSKPYRPGDDMHAIDWAASARLSTARQSDEFIVRERFAEEAPRIVLVCDRRPGMASPDPALPWLDKAAAMRQAVQLVLASAGASGGYVGYLDYADGEAHWRPPKGERKLLELQDPRLWSSEFGGPSDWLERSLGHLAQYPRAITAGTFVFLFSDFIPPPPKETWLATHDHPWDVVPVVIQDPVWEQSFPDVSGIAVPLQDPRTGKLRPVRLSASEAEERRWANEERLRGLMASFLEADLDPILVSSSDRERILSEFLVWAATRRAGRGRKH